MIHDDESYWAHEMMEEGPDQEEPDWCGNSISIGPAHDPYGATCTEEWGHTGPHRSPSPFGDGHVEWFGGGSCAGDALPIRDLHFIEDR